MYDVFKVIANNNKENKEPNGWVKFDTVDYNDENFNKFNIDTRDFHVGQTVTDEVHKDLKVLEKYPNKFFLTVDKLKSIVERFYIESGGEKEWRMMDLVSKESRVTGWRLKYLRIQKYVINGENRFLVCNSYGEAIPSHLLDCSVDQEHLNSM